MNIAQRLSAHLGQPVHIASREPWASVTFTGERIQLLAERPVNAGELCLIDFDTTTELVADITTHGDNRLEVLIVFNS